MHRPRPQRPPMIARIVCPALLTCPLWVGPAMPSARAQSVESFYRGRAVTLMVGTAPGGINDISARLVARHLGRFIPGNPTLVVQTMPGAGGLVTANRIYNGSERDGSVLGKPRPPAAALGTQPGQNPNFRPTQLP